MAKHNQRNTLGSLTDFQSAPQPTPETTDERFDRLEHRLLQVETLLNDVMQQLDKPYRDQPHSNGKPKQAKPKQAKPKQAKPSTPKAKETQKAPTPPTPAATDEQKQADIEAVIPFLHQHPDRLWKPTQLQKAIKAHCNLTNRRATSAIKRLRKTGLLVNVKDVEVDGEKLDWACQFKAQPQPDEPAS